MARTAVDDRPVSEEESRRPLRQHFVQQLLIALEEVWTSEDGPPEYAVEAEALLRDVIRERATDIHLDAGAEGLLVRLRVDGKVIDCALLDLDQGQRLVNQFKTMAGLDPIVRHRPEEGRITCPVDEVELDLRLARLPSLRGDKISIRIFMPDKLRHDLRALGTWEEGLDHMQAWIDSVSGMFLVAGPTGSGKTTTLYAMLHRLKFHERNVVTIEDPVEYEVVGINQIQVDKRHDLDFAEGMKAVLRMDPDYLMLGEIRDPFSARAALTAAQSGHPLMSTLHSRDAVGVIDTLRHHGLDGHEISANLMLVVAQRLVRTLCPHCKEPGEPSEDEKAWLKLLNRAVPDKVWNARGCEYCRGLGYEGRTGVFEVWRIDGDEYQLILEDADRRTLYRHPARRGHRFLIDDGLAKVADGITTLAEFRSMGGISALPNVD